MTLLDRSIEHAGEIARSAASRLEICAAWALMCIGLFFLGGCATDATRTVVVHQPLTARPAVAPAPVVADGAIYRAASFQPLFEDRRARAVGDTLTIRIDEKLNASKTANTNTDRKGSTTFNLADVKFGNTNVFKGGSITGGSDLKFEGGGDSGAKNVFTGSITVTVIEVLPNGNLVVSGEKQIGINTGSEFVRLSGVVNPVTILAGNVVSSIQVADARLEYRGAGAIDEANTMGWLARVFQSVLPF
jgi:flagellar L-ring protein precursor FlgH